MIISLASFFSFLEYAIIGIGYIQSSSLFPEPLNSEEEKIYLDRLSKGDEEARNILIERNLRLVAHVCKKYSSTNIEQDDLISIGTIGLIKGINSFKTDKNIKLATYVARCIENVVVTCWNKIYELIYYTFCSSFRLYNIEFSSSFLESSFIFNCLIFSINSVA